MTQEKMFFDKWNGFVKPCTENRSYFQPFSQIVHHMDMKGLDFLKTNPKTNPTNSKVFSAI